MSQEQYQLCRHIFTNGKPCNSPALVGKNLCYFHTKLHKRHKNLKEFEVKTIQVPQEMIGSHALAIDYHKTVTVVPLAELDLPPLEDAESIQISISLIIGALAAGRVDPKRATALLYGLQLASSNVGKLRLDPTSPVRDFIVSRSGLELTA